MTAARNFHPDTESRDDHDVKRDAIITIRLGAEEREAWQLAADADQRKLADWVRIMINRQLNRLPVVGQTAVEDLAAESPRTKKAKASKKGGK